MSSGGNTGGSSRNSLTRNSNTPLLTTNTVNPPPPILNNSTTPFHHHHAGSSSSGTIYHAGNNRSMLNNSTTNNNNTSMNQSMVFNKPSVPVFGNPVPLINNSTNGGNSPASTFIPPPFNQSSRGNTSSSSSTSRPSPVFHQEPSRQQFIVPQTKPQPSTTQRPQIATPNNTQKRVNNFPHSGFSTPKSGKKQPLHLVSCLSPTQTQLSTPNRTQTPSSTPVQTNTKYVTPNSSIYPFSNSTNTNVKPVITPNTSNSSHPRFVAPLYSKQEHIPRSSSSITNMSDSQKENEELEKLKAELENWKAIANKKKMENEELAKSKKEIEEQLLAAQSKLEENQHENSGMLDDDNADYLFAVLEEIDDDKMKDDEKTTLEESSLKAKEESPPNTPTTDKPKEERQVIITPTEIIPKKPSKKRIKWKNKNISDLQKDVVLHKALYKLLTYKGNSNNQSEELDTDENQSEESQNLSGRLWKAHRIISNDQSKMFLLLPILNAYLKRSTTEYDCELFICTLETILKLVLESEIFRSAFIGSFSQEISFIELKLKKIIQENGFLPHPLFSNPNIIIPESKKSIVKNKIRERKKYLHYYIDSVPYQPDFIFDPETDKTIIFNPEDVPVSNHDEIKTDLLSELLGYFSSLPLCFDYRETDIYYIILEIVKTLAIWSPENLLQNFTSLIDGQHLTIKNILGSDNVLLVEKSLEVLTVLVKSEKIRNLLQSNNMLTRVSAFLNVDIGTTDDMLRCRRMILRLFHYLAFLCPDGITLLKEKHNENTIIFDAMILLLRKELESIALLEDFTNETAKISLVRDIIVIFNHVSAQLNSPISYVSPSLRLDYLYAKTTISIIREKSTFKEKFQLDLMN